MLKQLVNHLVGNQLHIETFVTQLGLDAKTYHSVYMDKYLLSDRIAAMVTLETPKDILGLMDMYPQRNEREIKVGHLVNSMVESILGSRTTNTRVDFKKQKSASLDSQQTFHKKQQIQMLDLYIRKYNHSLRFKGQEDIYDRSIEDLLSLFLHETQKYRNFEEDKNSKLSANQQKYKRYTLFLKLEQLCLDQKNGFQHYTYCLLMAIGKALRN